MGKAAKKASELMDVDLNKNEKMKEQFLNGSVRISGRTETPSGKQASLHKDSCQLNNEEFNSSMKKKKKNKKGFKSLQNNVVDHHLLEDASTKKSARETIDGSLKTNSEMTQLADLSSLPGNKKRERKNKNMRCDALKLNDANHDNPGCISSIENSLLERESFTQPLANTCLKADSKIKQYDAEVNLSEDMNEGKEQKKRHNAPKSNNTIHDFQKGDGRPRFRLTNTSVLSFLEKVSTSLRCEDTSSTRKHDDHPKADVIKTYERKKQDKTNCRKKKKASNIPSIEGVDGSMPVLRNKIGDTSLDHSDEALISGALENTAEREIIAGHRTSLQVVENIFIAKKASGGCSDGEPADEESKKIAEMETINHAISEDDFVKNVSTLGSLEENFEQANRCKIDVIENAVQNIYSVEESFNRSSSFEGKGLVEASGIDLSDKHLDKNVLEIQSTIEDAMPSPLVAINDDASLVISKEECSLQAVQSSPGRSLTGCFRKKLLILDVNGLLADILRYASDGYQADTVRARKPDTVIAQKAVYKRPFCDDFLEFCFERFNVGVWSSRTKNNMESVLDFLMGKTKCKLLFRWDQSHCTETGYKTIENNDKPLLLKELKKLWEKHEPNLPWERREYNESSTLLLDDSPYKALCNPPNTAVFPYTYDHKNVRDNSLGPGGDLRVYLERLALTDDVQKYVEQNPFGQRPITERNPSWAFYRKVINSVLYQS